MGPITELLLLLAQHAQHTQRLVKAAAKRAGLSRSDASQLARRQAADFQTWLAALLPLQSPVAHGSGEGREQTSLLDISHSLLLASVQWHLVGMSLHMRPCLDSTACFAASVPCSCRCQRL